MLHRSLAARLAVVLLVLGVTFSAFAAAVAKKYQVTGKVLEVNDKSITVEKGDEKWEIDRTADTKVDGDLKAGAKVTIHYHMVADSVDTK
ncbi:MAG TPA: hypothetical protein VLI90_12615 [Tepidisphaeraceae bacterium]|nr:hypothetical protein [Tepidisphaeraceae bacterium]